MHRQQKQINLDKKGELFVRDHLAELRTELANRRTLLSHIRTALAFMGGGLALVKFAGHPLAILIGWILVPVGLFILGEGIVTYVKVVRAVRMEKKKTDAAEQACD